MKISSTFFTFATIVVSETAQTREQQVLKFDLSVIDPNDPALKLPREKPLTLHLTDDGVSNRDTACHFCEPDRTNCARGCPPGFCSQHLGQGNVKECELRISSNWESEVGWCKSYCQMLGIGLWSTWCMPELGWPELVHTCTLIECIKRWNFLCYDTAPDDDFKFRGGELPIDLPPILRDCHYRIGSTDETKLASCQQQCHDLHTENPEMEVEDLIKQVASSDYCFDNKSIQECESRLGSNNRESVLTCKGRCTEIYTEDLTLSGEELLQKVIAENSVDDSHNDGCYDVKTIKEWGIARCEELVTSQRSALAGVCKGKCRECAEDTNDYNKLVQCVVEAIPGTCEDSRN